MQISDFSYKKKYSHIRFGYELSLFFLLIFIFKVLDLKIAKIDWFILSISVFLVFLAIIRSNLLKFINKIFLIFFNFLSKLINPILIVIVYIISIVPIAILKKLSFNSKNTDSNKGSYWTKKKISSKELDINEQF